MLEVKQVASLIEQHILDAGFPIEPTGLYGPARYILNAGGKRIRPCLALMCANLFTDNPTPQIPVALAMEVFHNFTLVHDDIMDKAPVRRGLQTVHEKWNIHTGILSGDVMMIQSYKLLCQADAAYLVQLLNMFNTTAMQVCEGQQLDMDFETRVDVNLQEYINMITNKTSVLLGASMYCGAIAAGAGEIDANLLYKAGLELGVSFQIQDDVLDAYGDEIKFGKKPGGDIVQQKKTFLILKALEKASPPDKQTLIDVYHSKSTNEAEKITKVLQLFDKYQIKAEAELLMQTYYDSAIVALQKVSVPEANKRPLYELVTSLFGRSH